MFDEKYKAEGWLLCRSIQRHIPGLPIYVLCLDDVVYAEALERAVRPVLLVSLETKYPELLGIKEERSWPAYTQTCKTFLPSAVLEMHGEGPLVYVDSDMFFWGDPRIIEGELGEASFMVVSREDSTRPAQGAFNGGFFACQNDDKAKAFLKWWQAETIKWCEWKPGPDGKFTEEGYLNIIQDEPDRFPGTKICQHPGINLAPWNSMRHTLELAGEGVIVDEEWPLVCFHYQGFNLDVPNFGLGAEPKGPTRYLYRQYAGRLEGWLED
jgi:hypothetical protein